MFTKIQTSMHDKVNQLRALSNNQLSALSFPILFMWQDYLNLNIEIESEYFIIKCSDNIFYFPCGSERGVKSAITTLLNHKSSFQLAFLSDTNVGFLEKYFSGKYTIIEDRNSFEYIGSISSMSELYGKKYAKIRHEINNFSKKHNKIVFKMLSKCNLNDVIYITKLWSKQKNDELENDVEIILNNLSYYDLLSLNGLVFYIDDLPIGYVIWSELSDDTVDIHFSKTTNNDIGSDYLQKKIFCDYLKGKYQFFNMEDDMGVEGLRVRKQLLKPVSITKIYKAIF